MTAQVKANWFWPLALLLVAMAWLLARFPSDDLPQNFEYAVIFDVLVSMPLLFVICYRAKLPRNQMIFRILALQCLGIWIAGKIIPLENQLILPQLSWLRSAGLVVLIALELWIMITVCKIAFSKSATADHLSSVGIPPMLAKLMLIEARFWRRIFSFFKR